MTTVKNETIVDRVVARLKAQPIGDLITEEDLHDIVKEAIPKAFFEKRWKVEGSGYHERKTELEPAIVEVMRELLRDSAKEAVKNWMAANATRLLAHWKEVTDAGLLKYVQQIQNEQATGALKVALGEWVRILNEERQKMGLPHIYPPA
jgi:hypothetical protein